MNISLKAQDGGNYDVIVCGGGTSGAIAGIMAAKLGMKTLVIERYGALGGSQTMAYVMPIMWSFPGSYYQYSAANAELVQEMKKDFYGYAIAEESISSCNAQWFDGTKLPKAMEDLIYKYGGEILYDTSIVDVVKEGNKIVGIVGHNYGGLYVYNAKYFVDATANGTVAVCAGAKYSSGNKDGVNQAVSLRFEMAQIDMKKFVRFMDSEDENPSWEKNYDNFKDKYNLVWTDKYISRAYDNVLKKAVANGELTEQDVAHVQLMMIPGRENFASFNCPELGMQKNVLDPKFISKKYSEGRTAVLRMAECFKKYMGGFENAVISSIAPMLGVRETREIQTEYTLTIHDLAKFTKFEDAFAKTAYPVDIHGQKTDKVEFDKAVPKSEQYYTFPVRSLIVKDIDNLMVAGRCIGTDFVTQSISRQQHVCRASGEACAIAIKQCLDKNAPCRATDGVLVKKTMQEMGVQI